MSSTKQDWTPEPWHFRTREMDGIGCYSNDIRIYQGTREGGSSEWVADCGCETDPIRHKNARRIVACVNALAGIPDPAAYVKAMREVVTAAEAVKSTIGTDGKITWTHANAVWLLKAVDALRTLSTPESEVKRGKA